MATDLICPDCGGIVGATQVTDEGKPCTCFSAKIASPQSESSPSTGNDTSIIDRPVIKVCCKCGIDLTGKKRLKDSVGYWCMDCVKAEEKKNKPQGVKCPGCSRIVAEAALADYEGIPLCARCRHERAEEKKAERRRSPVSSENFKEHDKRKIYAMAGVLAVLLIIILLSHFGVIGH